jgi:hypothetical protein
MRVTSDDRHFEELCKSVFALDSVTDVFFRRAWHLFFDTMYEMLTRLLAVWHQMEDALAECNSV